MKIIKAQNLCATLALILLIVLIGSIHAKANDKTDPNETEVQIKELLGQIQNAIITVQNSAGATEKLPELKSVTLNLSTEMVEDGKAGINIWIISIGTKASKDAVQTISLKLKPPKPKPEMAKKLSEISEPLANAILAAARGAESSGPMLELSELEASIKFVIKKQVDGQLKFQILPLTDKVLNTELGGELSQTLIQEIIVSYEVEEDK